MGDHRQCRPRDRRRHRRRHRRRRGRRAVIAAVTAVLVMMPAPGAVGAGDCWPEPVAGTVVDPFREPACPWCPGNRGLEYQVESDVPVRSVASGRAAFVGTIAGVTYAVVELPSGWRLTYGMLTSTVLAPGDAVLAGTVVGRASERFHFGLRIGGEYRDPAPHLGRLVGRPRLIPLDGTPARPAPSPSVSCVPPRAR